LQSSRYAPPKLFVLGESRKRPFLHVQHRRSANTRQNDYAHASSKFFHRCPLCFWNLPRLSRGAALARAVCLTALPAWALLQNFPVFSFLVWWLIRFPFLSFGRGREHKRFRGPLPIGQAAIGRGSVAHASPKAKKFRRASIQLSNGVALCRPLLISAKCRADSPLCRRGLGLHLIAPDRG